jgi:hypothetical protein
MFVLCLLGSSRELSRAPAGPLWWQVHLSLGEERVGNCLPWPPELPFTLSMLWTLPTGEGEMRAHWGPGPRCLQWGTWIGRKGALASCLTLMSFLSNSYTHSALGLPLTLSCFISTCCLYRHYSEMMSSLFTYRKKATQKTTTKQHVRSWGW